MTLFPQSAQPRSELDVGPYNLHRVIRDAHEAHLKEQAWAHIDTIITNHAAKNISGRGKAPRAEG